MKYNIGFSRKVQTKPYENIEFTLTAEFSDEEAPLEYMKKTVVETVEKWIDEELSAQGLKRPKKEIILRH